MTNPWENKTLDSLIRHIIDTHHAYIRSEMPSLERLISSLCMSADPPSAEALQRVQRVFQFFRRDLQNHLEKEEVTLFPLIQQMESAQASGQSFTRPSYGSIRHLIDVMEEEHRVADQEMRMICDLLAHRLQHLSNDASYSALVQQLSRLDADLQVHVQLEDGALFPRACALEHE